MNNPRQQKLTGVVSWTMFRLFCKVGPGVFSNERLIQFLDATGQPHSALVDKEFVEEQAGNRSWIWVRATVEGPTAVVALPSDGSRVRVGTEAIEAVS
jgi:hypothetical protein